MKQEDKDLLLKDLCARLPYGVKFNFNGNVYILSGIDECVDDDWDWIICLCSKGISPIYIEYCNPYLFPLSSMTEEQNLEYLRTCKGGNASLPTLASFEWLNENHFDYRGLIEKELAIDATGLDIY